LFQAAVYAWWPYGVTGGIEKGFDRMDAPGPSGW
jgi:hypothetical protein